MIPCVAYEPESLILTNPPSPNNLGQRLFLNIFFLFNEELDFI